MWLYPILDLAIVVSDFIEFNPTAYVILRQHRIELGNKNYLDNE